MNLVAHLGSIAFLGVVCCGGTGSQGPTVAGPSSDPTPAPGTARLQTHICRSSEGPRSSSTRALPPWKGLAFDKAQEILWAMSSETSSGPGTLERLSRVRNGPVRWSFPATWTYQRDTGTVQIQTTEGNSSLHQINLNAQVPSGRRSSVGELREIWVPSGSQGQPPFTTEVVLFIDHEEDLLRRFERMHRCASEAISASRK